MHNSSSRTQRENAAPTRKATTASERRLAHLVASRRVRRGATFAEYLVSIAAIALALAAVGPPLVRTFSSAGARAGERVTNPLEGGPEASNPPNLAGVKSYEATPNRSEVGDASPGRASFALTTLAKGQDTPSSTTGPTGAPLPPATSSPNPVTPSPSPGPPALPPPAGTEPPSIFPDWVVSTAKGVGSFFVGAFCGNFCDDNSIPAIAGQTAVGFIPYVGQAADARDTVQAIWDVIENHDAESAINLGTTLAGWIPGLDAVKSGRATRRALSDEEHALAQTAPHDAPNGPKDEAPKEQPPGDESGQSCSEGICGPKGPCFAAGTLVRTEHGPRPIESIAVNERVWSRDPLTGVEGLQPVVQRFVTPHQPLLAIEVGVEAKRTEILHVTREHPFWTQRGWTAAGELRREDFILLLSGSWAPYVAGEDLGVAETVYNLEVASTHTYFVGSAGMLVHNTCRKEIEQVSSDYYSDLGTHLAATDPNYKISSDSWSAGASTVNHENIIDHYLKHETDFVGAGFDPTLEQYAEMGVAAAHEVRLNNVSPEGVAPGPTRNTFRYRLDTFVYQGRVFYNVYVDYALVGGAPKVVSFGTGPLPSGKSQGRFFR